MASQSLDLIAERIKQRRHELGLSLQSIADQTGISRSTLQRYETGGIKNIPIKRLEGLATALQTTPEWIMGTYKDDWYSSLIDLYREFNWGSIPSPEDAAILLQRNRPGLLPFNSKNKEIILSFLTKDEEILVYCYKMFTPEGQQKIREYMSDLGSNHKYIKDEFSKKDEE